MAAGFGHGGNARQLPRILRGLRNFPPRRYPALCSDPLHGALDPPQTPDAQPDCHRDDEHERQVKIAGVQQLRPREQ